VIASVEGGFYKRFDDFIAAKLLHLEAFLKDPLKLELFENPAYLIQTALYYLFDKPKVAEKMLTKAIEMDPNWYFGPIARYYRALALLKQGQILFREENKRTEANDGFDKQAKEDIKKVMEEIKGVCSYIAEVQATTISDSNSRLAQQNGTLVLLNAFIWQCNKTLAKFEELNLNPGTVIKVGRWKLGLVELHREYLAEKEEDEMEKRKADACLTVGYCF
jgi:tetratricopeptide (TPR) repeat protein